MKMLGIVGSMRKKGKTSQLVRSVLDSARQADSRIKTRVLQISDLNIEPCRACYDECSKEPYQCAVQHDDLQKVLEEMKTSHAIVIGAPLYFKIPSRLAALMERLVALAYFYEGKGFKEPHPLDDKPCGLIAVSGGDDPRPVFEYLFNFALSLKMRPIIMKQYPYYGVGARGEIEKDDDMNPIENAKTLGRLLAKAIEESKKVRIHNHTRRRK